jgi:glycosyltransferase involved in cell wall biosynthesis
MSKPEVKIGKRVRADDPKVSVVIPVYNIAAYIAETLDSVLAQTFKNYEIILINDGSTDTAELEKTLAPYLDDIIYAEQENAGASQARNTAINLARGELLAFLDGDDVWLPGFLESQTNFLEKNDYQMVYCDALIFGDALLGNQTFMQGSPSNGAVTTVSLINTDCNVITSGTVLKKNLLEKFGSFDLELRRAQDFDLWFRLAKNNVRIGYQREVLLKYRVRPGNLTGSSVDRAARNISVMNSVRKKYELDERETEAWEKQFAVFEAELELEKGKHCLVEGDFSGAQTHLARANEFYRKPKLSLINWLLRFSPRLTARLFKAVRPSEFSFISPNKH